MPLIKLNRINKGGEIFINSDHIVYMEVESRSTTIHMVQNLLFSVEEPLEVVATQIEGKATERISKGIQQSGLTSSP